jgi:hypothetical protein
MRKKIVLVVIIVILGILIMAFLKFNADDKQTIELKYDRIEEIVRDDNGNVLAEMYFVKPILIGNQESVKIINQFFEREANYFFRNSGELVNSKYGDYNQFMRSVDEAREYYGDSALAEHNFANTVNVKMMYQNEEIISFKEETFWFAGGINNYSYYGETFNLQSGEILTVEEFTEQDLKDFKDNVISQLSQNFYKDYQEIRDKLIDEVANYKFADYNYYYDGNDIYLIFNTSNLNYILKLEN